MSTACLRLKSPCLLSGTSAHPTMVTLVNIMVMNGWLTSFSFYVNRLPHSGDITISDSDLETPRSRSGVWSRCGHTVGPVSYQLTSLSFHINQANNSWDTDISQFDLETLKVKSWVRSKVNVTYYTQYRTDALPFRFTSIRPTIPEIGQNSVWPWKNTSQLTMARAIRLSCL